MLEQIRTIFLEELGCDPDLLTPEANLRTDLGVDSLDILGVVVTLEDEYGITVNEDELDQIQTLQDVVQYVQAHA